MDEKWIDESKNFSKINLGSKKKSNNFFSSIVDHLTNITGSDLGAFYFIKNDILPIGYKIGGYDIPEYLRREDELILFMEECRELVVVLERKKNFFNSILLNRKMNSGTSFLIANKINTNGILFLNSSKLNFYDRKKLLFLDSFLKDSIPQITQIVS